MITKRYFFLISLCLLANNKILPSLENRSNSPLIDVLSTSNLDNTLSYTCSESSYKKKESNLLLKENHVSIENDEELNSTKTALKVGSFLTVMGIVTAGVIHCYQEKDKPIRRSSLISAGDVFGAGGVAQGAGGIAKGVALEMAAGGAIFVARKFYNLIDLRIEAQEEKHKADKELALRKNNDEWRIRLREMLDDQKKDIESMLSQRNQDMNNKYDKDKKDLLTKIISPVINSVDCLKKDLEREKERTHRRNEPIIEAITNINEFLTTKVASISPSGSTLGALKKNIDELNNKEDSSFSVGNETFHNQLEEIRKVVANASNQPSSPANYTLASVKFVEPKVTEKEKTCCPCC